MRGQKQVPKALISNYIPQGSVGYNYLFMIQISLPELIMALFSDANLRHSAWMSQ